MRNLKILVLHASAGAGHTQCALAITEALRAADPECQVQLRDTLQFSTKMFHRAYVVGYNNMVRRAPGLWGFLWYRSADTRLNRRTSSARLALDRLSVRSLKSYLVRERPDAVVTTHFLPLALLASLRTRDPGQHPWSLHCVITDFTAHPWWVFPGVSRYFVSSENVRAELADQGVTESRVSVTGIPVGLRFAHRGDQGEARARLGLGAGPTALVMGGGIGMGRMAEVVQGILDVSAQFQVIVVCGKNARLRRALQRRYQDGSLAPGRVAIRGFVKDVDRLMDAADLVVGKAGGLTSSESLAKGLPMLVLDPIPGQEDRNSNYLVSQGAAIRLEDLSELSGALLDVLAPGGRLPEMTAAARGMGRPHAAEEVARAVLAFEPVSGGATSPLAPSR